MKTALATILIVLATHPAMAQTLPPLWMQWDAMKANAERREREEQMTPTERERRDAREREKDKATEVACPKWSPLRKWAIRDGVSARAILVSSKHVWLQRADGKVAQIDRKSLSEKDRKMVTFLDRKARALARTKAKTKEIPRAT